MYTLSYIATLDYTADGGPKMYQIQDTDTGKYYYVDFGIVGSSAEAVQYVRNYGVVRWGLVTGATKTKVTYNEHGIVTAGVDATTADIADSTNKRYVTDAELVVIGNTSGTNTGDQDLSGYVPTSRRVNGYLLGYDVSLSTADVADSTNKRYVTDAQLASIGAGWQLIMKHTDEVRTSTTTDVADTDLQFPIDVLSDYIIKLRVYFGSDATPDFKYSITITGSPTKFWVYGRQDGSGAGTSPGTDNETTFTGTAAISGQRINCSGTLLGYLFLDILVTTDNMGGLGGGTFSFDWSQDTSDSANTTVMAGSCIEYMKL